MIRTLSAITAFSLITGCSTLDDIQAADEQNLGLCPNIFALEDAARVIEFDGEPALETVAWSAEITDVRTSCRYVGDRPITAKVEIDFAVGRGPASSSNTHDVDYFVAVTRRNRDVIAKESFTVPIRVRDGLGTIEFTENIREIEIPRANENTAGSNFEIAVGFSLTREQVLYNRSGKSLKFPEL